MEKGNQFESHDSVENLRNYEYVRTMGSFKPRFEGIPDEYFPLTTCEGLMYACFVLFIIGATLGIMIGFLFWVTNKGLEGFIIVWSIIFLVFLPIMMAFFYVGGRGRIRE
jgi:hypothetical protein